MWPLYAPTINVVVIIFASNAFKLTTGWRTATSEYTHKRYVNAYIHIMNTDTKLILDQVFNVGFENKSVSELAELAASAVKSNVIIEKQATNDPRSYKINSDKIRNLTGFALNFQFLMQ